MQYMGGKERIHKHILRAIEFAKWDSGAAKYLEPFVGGASIASRITGFDEVVLSDVEPLVADVWNAARAGWSPYPIDLQQYHDLRSVVGAGPQAGYAAFGVSYGGRKWQGFAKDREDRKYSQTAAAAGIARKALGLPVDIQVLDYTAHTPEDGWVVYCDPPYAGTKAYDHPWNADKFWEVADSWVDAGAVVLVSEYAAPDHWSTMWSRRKHVAMGRETLFAVERLFTR